MKKSKTEILALIIILLGMVMIAVPLITKYMVNNEENVAPKNTDKEEKKEKGICNVEDTRLSIERDNWPDTVNVGDIVTIKASITGLNEECEREITWKYQEVGSSTWVDIDPNNDENYQVSDDQLILSVVANELTISRSYYAVLDYK